MMPRPTPRPNPHIKAIKALLKRLPKALNSNEREKIKARVERLRLSGKVSSCESCPLRGLSCRDPFPSIGPIPPILHILVGSPTKSDMARKHKPGERSILSPRTKEGDLIDDLVSEIGINPAEVHFSYAVKCGLINNLGGSTSHHTNERGATCIERFGLDEVRASRAIVVLSMGELAYELLCDNGVYGKTEDAYHKVGPLSSTLDSITYIHTYDPTKSVQNSSVRAKVRQAIELVGETIQARMVDYLERFFPGVEVVEQRTYEDCVDEALGVISLAIKGEPPHVHRVKILSMLRRVAEELKVEDPSKYRYAVRMLGDVAAGRVVHPRIGDISK